MNIQSPTFPFPLSILMTLTEDSESDYFVFLGDLNVWVALYCALS